MYDHKDLAESKFEIWRWEGYISLEISLDEWKLLTFDNSKDVVILLKIKEGTGDAVYS